MASNEIKLLDGRTWTSDEFLKYYLSQPASGTLVPVQVDMAWYMSEGPGRYYQPGMFPVVRNILRRNDLEPGLYSLRELAGGDKSDQAYITNYITQPLTSDFSARALLFGNESARIDGNVLVKEDGSKLFQNIEIRAFDTKFNFKRKTDNEVLEAARSLGRWRYDPKNVGTSYDIQYRGHGRVYLPFSDKELTNALAGDLQSPKDFRDLNRALRSRAEFGPVSTFSDRWDAQISPAAFSDRWDALPGGNRPD